MNFSPRRLSFFLLLFELVLSTAFRETDGLLPVLSCCLRVRSTKPEVSNERRKKKTQIKKKGELKAKGGKKGERNVSNDWRWLPADGADKRPRWEFCLKVCVIIAQSLASQGQFVWKRCNC